MTPDKMILDKKKMLKRGGWNPLLQHFLVFYIYLPNGQNWMPPWTNLTLS